MTVGGWYCMGVTVWGRTVSESIFLQNIGIKIMTNQNNILTEEEIKKPIGNLNRNPDETELRAVINYFRYRPMH